MGNDIAISPFVCVMKCYERRHILKKRLQYPSSVTSLVSTTHFPLFPTGVPLRSYSLWQHNGFPIN